MDPQWIAHFRSVHFEAELMVFYGPVVDVSRFGRRASILGTSWVGRKAYPTSDSSRCLTT